MTFKTSLLEAAGILVWAANVALAAVLFAQVVETVA
jgi:hypothetical protein